MCELADGGRDAFVGEIGILCDVPRTATIQATESLTTLKITKDLFYRMVADFPSISLEVMRTTGDLQVSLVYDSKAHEEPKP